MRIVNLTPHAVTFATRDGSRTIEASGDVARCTTRTAVVGEVDGILVTRTEFGDVRGLPGPQEGTIYVVSSLVAQRVPERADVFVPNEAVRDEHGRIVGCKSLGRV